MSGMPTKILVVEDDDSIATMLCTFFESNNINVVRVSDGLAGLNAVSKEVPDLIILDLVMPHLDGFSFMEKLRATGNNTPVIMLTCQKDTSDKIKGLEVGADDYITKPFSLNELMARIKAVMRRCSFVPRNIHFDLGNFSLDALKRTVINRVDNKEIAIPLTKTEFDILHYLLARKGEVVDRKELLEKVLGYDPKIETKTLIMHIGNLRRKLAENEVTSFSIKAVPGVGYKLEEKL